MLFRSDKFENMGAQMVREVASKTNDIAGDGTTTATVLAQSIVREGSKAVAAGMNPMDLKRGVDLAVEAGGNCTMSKPGEVVDVDGVKIVGHHNWPSRIAVDASFLYAKNLLNFITPQIDAESGELNIDWEDEIIQGVALTRDGEIVHPLLTEG